MAKKKADQKFAEVLLNAIDKALASLGKEVQFSIYFNLEAKFALPKQDIPDRTGDFSDALDQIFGSAARQLELLIMKYLNEQVQCNYRWVGPSWLVPNLTFEKYVKLVRISVEDHGATGDVEVLIGEGEKPEQET
ncbi:MAG: hypothetical protein NWE93_06760 [Candidatus Bathyarchaeota archaeon]|nr:hypothetical protein [Candidatus Bathyarchaeota archaeon]